MGGGLQSGGGMARAYAFRTLNHTLFNDRVLKLGTFSANLTGGRALFNIADIY